MATKEVVDAYIAAWNEKDETKRKQLIEQCWAQDATYTDPIADVKGRDGLAAAIAGFHAQMPDARIELTSKVDEHHGRIRFGWKLVNGPQPMEGIDIGQVAADGRLASIVGFWGANPPA